MHVHLYSITDPHAALIAPSGVLRRRLVRSWVEVRGLLFRNRLEVIYKLGTLGMRPEGQHSGFTTKQRVKLIKWPLFEDYNKPSTRVLSLFGDICTPLTVEMVCFIGRRFRFEAFVPRKKQTDLPTEYGSVKLEICHGFTVSSNANVPTRITKRATELRRPRKQIISARTRA